MATDLQNIRNYVRKQTLTETDDYSHDEIRTLLNEGINTLALRFHWPFLEATTTLSTTADTQTVALPSDYRQLISVTPSGKSGALTRLTIEQAIEEWGDDFPSGAEASWYFVFTTNIHLVPTPTATATIYDLYYRKNVTELTNETDTPEWISEYHLIPAYWAIAKIWEREEDYPKADAAMAQFDRRVEEMARYYNKRQEDHPLVYGDGVQPPRRRSNMPFLNDGSLA